MIKLSTSGKCRRAFNENDNKIIYSLRFETVDLKFVPVAQCGVLSKVAVDLRLKLAFDSEKI
jgi:hypothetical protein